MRTPEDRFYLAVLIAAGLLVTLTIFFVITMVRHQRRNRRMFLASINASIVTLEAERKRIVADLHDEIGPLISAIKMQMSGLELTDPDNVTILNKSAQYIDDILQKIRSISYNLLPNTLVRSGLVPAIEEYIDRMEAGSGTRIAFSHEGAIKLSKTAEVNLYRIVQEITHNALKHAEARELRIRLEGTAQRVLLHTTDDGKGFVVDESSEQAGYGLINLKSRAEVLGADWRTQSEPGRGTHYHISIPISNHHEDGRRQY